MPDDQKKPPKLPVKPHKEATFPPPTEPETDPPQKPQPETTITKARPGRSTRESAPVAEGPADDAAAYAAMTDEEKWPILVKAFHANRRRLLRMQGVTAVDIGYKIIAGSFTDILAVRLHVERKVPDDLEKATTVYKLLPCEFIPGHEELDEETKNHCFKLKGYEYLPTDVIEADYAPMQGAEPPRPRMMMQEPRSSEKINRRRRIDPLVGGISIGGSQTPVGTLGALVWDKTDGSVCILSNWHVLSGDLGVEAGAPCFQPGRFDQGRSSDVVALLKRWSFDRFTDAALAELTGSRHYCAGEIISMDGPISGVADPYLGMLVHKSGRSTRHTWGFIDGLYFSSAIEYSDGIVQVFENQIHIAPAEPDDPISDPGDSGSLWVSEKHEAVGLHFAGDLPHSAFGEYALANPIKLVMEALNFSFRPGFLEIRDEDLTPPPPLPVEHRGNGIHPVGNLRTRLTGSGGQPDPIRVGST